MPPHPLTNFEIQKYYQNESKFNGLYSRDNLPDTIKEAWWVFWYWNPIDCFVLIKS